MFRNGRKVVSWIKTRWPLTYWKWQARKSTVKDLENLKTMTNFFVFYLLGYWGEAPHYTSEKLSIINS